MTDTYSLLKNELKVYYPDVTDAELDEITNRLVDFYTIGAKAIYEAEKEVTIETAYAMKQLVDEFGFTQEALAKRLGVSRPNVTNTIRLLSLAPEVMALVEQGKIAPNSARALIPILDQELQVELAKKAISQQLTTRQIEKMVKEVLNPDRKKQKSTMQTSPELFELKDLMQRSFSTKVNIIGNDNKGRIYIDYYTRDDLDRISEVLNKINR